MAAFFQKLKRRISPIQSLSIGFIGMTLLGAFLLTIPEANINVVSQSFIDALFMATSAISTTGLSVVDIGSYYSYYGQLIILFLIQLGGLGYMIFIVLILTGLADRLSFGQKILLRESISQPTHIEVESLVKSVIVATFVFEMFGACFLSAIWWNEFSHPKAIYYGLFHSISAFCTAGFGLFSDSFMSYRFHPLVHSVLAIVCLAGAIGFFCINDLFIFLSEKIRGGPRRRLLVHTKCALIITALLILWGTAMVFYAEPSESGSRTHGLMSASFQVISAATTTGFSTLDIGKLSLASLLVIIFLMFIGASPGGTGGGIKTTSFGVMLSYAYSFLTGREEAILLRRQVSPPIVNRAYVSGFLAVLTAVIGIGILAIVEPFQLIQIVFEGVSALGTVGLSTGITPHLSVKGKLVITALMLIGRLGPLSVAFSLVRKTRMANIKYAEGTIMVA